MVAGSNDDNGTSTAPGKRSTPVSFGSRTSTRTTRPSLHAARNFFRRQIAHSVTALQVRHGALLVDYL